MVFYVIKKSIQSKNIGMISLSEIRELSTEEKLQLIEIIWQELSVHEDEIEVPQAHKDLLEKRTEMVKEGKADFLDWKDVKDEIENLDR